VNAKILVRHLSRLGFRPAFFDAMGTNMTIKLPSDKQVYVKFTNTWAHVEIRSASFRDREQDVFVMTENKEALQMISEIMEAEKNG
jgi:hypothetical protein